MNLKKIAFISLSCMLLASCDEEKKPWETQDPYVDPTPSQKPDPKPDPVDPTPVVQAKLDPLHVDGRWLCNSAGERINLHGFWQTYSPWFNGDAWGVHNWGDYNVDDCLRYNKKEIDNILAAGWKVDFMRLHMDPYWSVSRSRPWPTTREEYEDFDETLFKEYLDKVFVPMVEYCISKGLYVVLMPGYSAPEYLEYGDQFFKVLEKLWTNISKHPKLCNNTDVMFEIVNEPRSIKANGNVGNNDDAHNQELTRYMQYFVDLIRQNASNIIWVPGTGYQSQYAGYAKYKMKGKDLGFAVHCYPGWYGSDAEQESAELGGSMGGGYDAFQAGWNNQILPAAEIAPIMITEMDWAPKIYNKSWGKSFTGEAGGSGFGANFKYLADKTENVSYILFTAPNDLADYGTKYASGSTNYWNDWRGCPWQIYHWYQEYAEGRIQPASAESIKIGGSDGGLKLTAGTERNFIVNAIQAGKVVYPLCSGVEAETADPSIARIEGEKIIAVSEGETTVTAKALGQEVSCKVIVNSLFPLDAASFDVNIWEKGTYNESTKTFTTGQYGFAGWHYSGLDISSHKYIVVKLGDGTDFSCQPSFRLFDKGYWDGAAEYNFNNQKELRVEIARIKRADGGSFNTKNVNIIGFWTLGFKPVVIESIEFED